MIFDNACSIKGGNIVVFYGPSDFNSSSSLDAFMNNLFSSVNSLSMNIRASSLIAIVCSDIYV